MKWSRTYTWMVLATHLQIFKFKDQLANQSVEYFWEVSREEEEIRAWGHPQAVQFCMAGFHPGAAKIPGAMSVVSLPPMAITVKLGLWQQNLPLDRNNIHCFFYDRNGVPQEGMKGLNEP